MIRKGCTPARPGREGFVVGSMGDESAILEGVESSEAEESLVLDAHAGSIRVMHTLRPLGVAMAGREVCWTGGLRPVQGLRAGRKRP